MDQCFKLRLLCHNEGYFSALCCNDLCARTKLLVHLLVTVVNLLEHDSVETFQHLMGQPGHIQLHLCTSLGLRSDKGGAREGAEMALLCNYCHTASY